MPLEANLIWNNKIVGTITDIVSDMWYMEGKWNRIESDCTETFERVTRDLDAREIFKDPFKGLMAELLHGEPNTRSEPVLIFSLENNVILMRIIADENLVRQLGSVSKSRYQYPSKVEKRSRKKMWWWFWK